MSNVENIFWKEVGDGKTRFKVIIGDKNKSLPNSGWLRSCYFCNTPTSIVNILIYNNKKYYVFNCKSCKVPPGCL